jgi:hydroxymethylbilane synthase
MQILKAGTRGSTLSLVQTNYFIDLLGKVHPDIEIKKIIIATKGDQDRTTPLYFLSQKSIFEKELNDEVLNGGSACYRIKS